MPPKIRNTPLRYCNKYFLPFVRGIPYLPDILHSQQGFNDVVNSGSSLATGKAMASSIIPISGKTGTAETYATDGSGNSVTTVNLNAVAYATAKDGTKLAVGIMYPHALDWKSKAHQNAVKAIMELYQNTH